MTYSITDLLQFNIGFFPVLPNSTLKISSHSCSITYEFFCYIHPYCVIILQERYACCDKRVEKLVVCTKAIYFKFSVFRLRVRQCHICRSFLIHQPKPLEDKTYPC